MNEPIAGQILPRVAVVACAVLEIELQAFVKRFPNVVHVEFLEQGLHNEPDKLRRELQAAMERVETRPEVEVVALGYGLCSRGSEGVRTRRCRMVMARAHDCITPCSAARNATPPTSRHIPVPIGTVPAGTNITFRRDRNDTRCFFGNM